VTGPDVLDAPAPDNPAPGMSPETFRDWRRARGYTGYRQVIADLRAPLATLSNFESGSRRVSAAMARMCRMVELLDVAAGTDLDALDDPADRRAVLDARAMLAAWNPEPVHLRVPKRREGWHEWRDARACSLAAMVGRLAFATRSAALGGVRARAQGMVRDWEG